MYFVDRVHGMSRESSAAVNRPMMSSERFEKW